MILVSTQHTCFITGSNPTGEGLQDHSQLVNQMLVCVCVCVCVRVCVCVCVCVFAFYICVWFSVNAEHDTHVLLHTTDCLALRFPVQIWIFFMHKLFS